MAARKSSRSSTLSPWPAPIWGKLGLNFARRGKSHSDLSLPRSGHDPNPSEADVPVQAASTEGESLLLCLCISLAINRKQPASDSLNKKAKPDRQG